MSKVARSSRQKSQLLPTTAIDTHIVTVKRDSMRPFPQSIWVYQTLKKSYPIPTTESIKSSVANQSDQWLRIIQFNHFSKQTIFPIPNKIPTSHQVRKILTNHQYATLPGLQPVYDGDSYNQEIPAKSIKSVTPNNASQYPPRCT